MTDLPPCWDDCDPHDGSTPADLGCTSCDLQQPTPLRWVPLPGDSCDECGGDVEAFTTAWQPGDRPWVWDEDIVRCVGCGATGRVRAEERE